MNSTAFREKVVAQWSRLTPFNKRIQRDLPPHFDAVRTASGEVDSAMKEIEERFLGISTSLESITTTGRDLVSHCESLISLALGQGGGEIMIDDAAAHIWRAVEFVENNDRNMEQLIRQLTNSNERISQTLATEQILVRTLAPLNFVKTLFRVESAGLTPDVQDMFCALAREIDRIRLRVEGGFREKFQLIRSIQGILSNAITHLLKEQTQAKASVAGLRQHMTESLAAMKTSYEKNRDRDTQLSGVSQAVNTETGKVVMSLQLQDILTQKLQHTRKVLQEMEESFAQLPLDRTEACRSLRFIEQSGKIVFAQLTGMKEELAKAGQTVGEGLQAIIQQMAALDGNCLALRDLDSVTTGVDGAVQILLDSLENVQQLMKTADQQAMEAHQTIEPIGGMTTNFTGFMRELSLEIQLIGLNAEVQAAHVGQGTGLEVLSAHTSEISRETSLLSEELAKDLDTLTAGLDQVVAGFREIRDENANFSKELEGEFEKDNAALHDYRNTSLTVLLHISELLPQLETQTRSALDQVDFAAVASAPLTALQSAVTDLANAAHTAANLSGVSVETKGLTDHHIGSYTMRSQVDIHHEAVNGKPAPDQAAKTSAPSTHGDIELFGSDHESPPPAPPTQSPTIQTPMSMTSASPKSVPPPPADNVDLWEDEPASSSQSVGKNNRSAA